MRAALPALATSSTVPHTRTTTQYCSLSVETPNHHTLTLNQLVFILRVSFLSWIFCTNCSPSTVVSLKQGQNTLDHGQSSGRSSFPRLFWMSLQCFCIIHVAEWMHMTQLVSTGLIKQRQGRGPSPSIAFLLPPPPWVNTQLFLTA